MKLVRPTPTTTYPGSMTVTMWIRTCQLHRRFADYTEIWDFHTQPYLHMNDENGSVSDVAPLPLRANKKSQWRKSMNGKI